MAVPTKLISTSQGFQDAKGTVVANGYLQLILSQNCEITASGGQVTTQALMFPLDSNGKITSTAIWFNDELTPSGTVYYAKLYASNGMTLVQDFGGWSITGASADLSTTVPTSSSTGAPGAVLLNPTAQQNINGQTLNMEGASVSFSAAASTTADSFLSRISAGIVAIGTAIGNALGTLKTLVISLPTSSNTLPATITNDALGGLIFTDNGGKQLQWNNFGQLFFNNAAGSTGAALTVGGTSATTGGMSIFVGAAGAANEMAAIVPADGATAALRVQAFSVRALSGGFLTGSQSFGVTNAGVVTGADLTGASTSNKVTLRNYQAGTGALTGNSSDQTIYTFSVPGNTIGIGKGIHARAWFAHSSGTASVTYKASFGGSSLVSQASTSHAAGGGILIDIWIFNNGATNVQTFGCQYYDGDTAGLNAQGTLAVDTTSAKSLTITFNVANTDQVTGTQFHLEQIQ